MKNKYAHKCICYEEKKGLNAIFLYFIKYQIYGGNIFALIIYDWRNDLVWCGKNRYNKKAELSYNKPFSKKDSPDRCFFQKYYEFMIS